VEYPSSSRSSTGVHDLSLDVSQFDAVGGIPGPENSGVASYAPPGDDGASFDDAKRKWGASRPTTFHPLFVPH